MFAGLKLVDVGDLGGGDSGREKDKPRKEKKSKKVRMKE